MIAEPTSALLQFFGRLHPVVLHLPIGLWFGTALLEFGGAITRKGSPRGAVATLAWASGLMGVVAAAAGWVLALEPSFGSHIDTHRWLGVAAAAIGLATATMAARSSRRAFRLLLLLELAVLFPAGHLGAEKTHGEGFLFEPFERERERNAGQHPTNGSSTPTTPPANANGATGPAPTPDKPTTPDPHIAPNGGTATTDPGTPAAEPSTFATAIQPLLTEHCTKCHGPKKKKGKLALDSQAGIEKGGENGPVIGAPKAEDNPMLQRLLLPLDDEDHMPPSDEPQLSPEQFETLRRWLAAGAPFTGVVPADGAGGGNR